ncbi:MAG TPA: D-glycerate dehydrogenase [Rhodospirillales bacterium]|jgi:lactate dehydrogenase-like 2-hydroxyacid dehydrogenase|nr:MAG: Glycerate dehydrogenase [Alphaproteobacteria bacterium MarineAlpha3_Bin2]HIC27949.1 D-glycerate dehydrogenase [Rhodospirillales bacterium]HIM24983.1 D-glycerate dehydrogenase [Rhodospirillales bacterium]
MSDKPVILVTRKLPDAVEARLKSDYEARLNPDDALYSKDELIERVQGAQGILPCHTEKFDSDMIAQLPNDVKIIANFSVGVDHCDLAAAKDKGIVVTNTPDVLSDATAEIAILLLLGAARRAGEGETLVRTRTWKDWSPSFMVGVQVTGKRLGIVGMGRVGQMVARRAKCFGMEIHYHNRSRLAPDLEDGAIYHNNLEDMLPLCQFLSLNCPNTPETAGMLNAGVISQLPDGAVVINTARGGVVDDDALIGALASGKLAAAGLDVFNNEPDIHTGYRDLKNTFLLPHIGSATAETRDAMGFRALDNLDAYFAGREPGDRVA